MTEATFWLAVLSFCIAGLALYVSWFDPSHRAKTQRRDEALERVAKFANLCRRTRPVGVGHSLTFDPELIELLKENESPLRYSDAHLLRRSLVESVDSLYTLTMMAWVAYSGHSGAITRYAFLFGDLPHSVLGEIDKEEHTMLPLVRLLRGRKAANRSRTLFRQEIYALLAVRTRDGERASYFAPDSKVSWESFRKLATLVGIGTAAQSVFDSLDKLPDGV